MGRFVCLAERSDDMRLAGIPHQLLTQAAPDPAEGDAG